MADYFLMCVMLIGYVSSFLCGYSFSNIIRTMQNTQIQKQLDENARTLEIVKKFGAKYYNVSLEEFEEMLLDFQQ